MAKDRIHLDLTKERPPHMWMSFDENDFTVGRWQATQYEGLSDYCVYCNHQGHLGQLCTVKKRNEEDRKRKESEAEKRQRTNKGLHQIIRYYLKLVLINLILLILYLVKQAPKQLNKQVTRTRKKIRRGMENTKEEKSKESAL